MNWRRGPAKWQWSAYVLVLATLHLGLAGFDFRKFFALWDAAWPFYVSFGGITSAGAVALHMQGRKYKQAEMTEGPEDADQR